MVAMDEISTIKNFFKSYHINLSNVWLESCVNWCKEENLPPNYAVKDLQLKVYEQWLLLDLRDVEVASLPPNLSQKVQYTLNGNYALQMMKVVDISKPKLWQLQRIRNTVPKNADEELESTKRVLQLTLTDGVQEIEAMEYKPIQGLNLNLTPGIKIMLNGPITVRRGRLMLQNDNVKILGGEIEDLIVPNAAENVLSRILNLPLNPNPQVIEESLLSANKDIFNERGGMARPIPQHQTIPRNNLQDQPSTTNVNKQQKQQLFVKGSTVPVAKPFQENNTISWTEEEEMRIADEVDMLMEVQRERETSNIKEKVLSKTPDMFDDMGINDYDFENIDVPTTVIKTSKELISPPVNNEKYTLKPAVHQNLVNNTQGKIDLSLSLEQDTDIFENLDIDSHLNKIDTEFEKKIYTPQKPVLTIEKLRNNIPNINNGKFKIKAKFKSVVEKLSVTDNGFHLVIQVEDESGDIAVRFHSDVVADLAGCCIEALLSLKTGVLEQNVDAQRKILEIVKRIKEKLLELDNIIEVQVTVSEKYPVVVNIL